MSEREQQEQVRHKEQVTATLATHPEMSDAEIGAHVGCSRQFVNRVRRQLGIASPVKKSVDAHEALYNALQEGMSRNNMLYEYVMDGVLACLRDVPTESHPQAAEDALNMLCVAMGKTPLDTLVVIHEFLRNYRSILKHGDKA